MLPIWRQTGNTQTASQATYAITLLAELAQWSLLAELTWQRAAKSDFCLSLVTCKNSPRK